MDDLISRQDVLHELDWCDYGLKDWQKWKLKMMVRDIPLAQPEPSTDIQDALRYLDDVLHPLISPNNWNVYSELHDMVSSLMTKELNTDALIEWVREHFCDRRFSCLHCPVNKECIDFAYDPLCDEEYAEDFKQALIDKFSVEVIDD